MIIGQAHISKILKDVSKHQNIRFQIDFKELFQVSQLKLFQICFSSSYLVLVIDLPVSFEMNFSSGGRLVSE